MNKTVDLPEEVFKTLEQIAAAHGQTPAEWIAAQLPRQTDPSGLTGKDFAAYLRQRTHRWRNDRLVNSAENHSQEFGDVLEQKRHEGNL